MDNKIAALETKRKDAVKSLTLPIILAAIGVIMFMTAGPFGIVMLAAAFVIYLVVSAPKIKQYKKSFKSDIVSALLNEVFEDVRFEPENGFSKEYVYNTGMVNSGNVYHSEDLVHAKYKDIEFTQADVLVQYRYSDKNGTHTVTYFQGRWMIFDFNKQFKSKMIVRDRAFGGGKNVTGLFSSGEYEKIEMENTEFNRMYKVSATDEHDAFYILTPHMMENMMELNRKINGELVLGFFNGKLHVAVHNNENSFEPHLFSTTDYGEMVRDVKGEIDMIVKFVEEMNLDRDIWEI